MSSEDAAKKKKPGTGEAAKKKPTTEETAKKPTAEEAAKKKAPAVAEAPAKKPSGEEAAKRKGPSQAEEAAKKKKKKPLRLSTYYKILDNGAVQRRLKTCPRCGPGTFLADHYDRISCGRCGYGEYKRKSEPSG